MSRRKIPNRYLMPLVTGIIVFGGALAAGAAGTHYANGFRDATSAEAVVDAAAVSMYKDILVIASGADGGAAALDDFHEMEEAVRQTSVQAEGCAKEESIEVLRAAGIFKKDAAKATDDRTRRSAYADAASIISASPSICRAAEVGANGG